MLSLEGGWGYETGLFAGVMVLDVVLVGIFSHCTIKVNFVASHVVALSELHRIFANILVVIGANILVVIFDLGSNICKTQDQSHSDTTPLFTGHGENFQGEKPSI